MFWSGLTPRDDREAGRVGALILVAPATILVVIGARDVMRVGSWRWLAESESGHGSLFHAAVLPLVFLALSFFMRYGPQWVPRYMSLPIVLGGALLACWSNIVTEDRTAGSQLFFLFPVTFAAYILRPLGAWVTAAVCVLADFYSIRQLATPSEVTHEASAMIVAIGAVTFVLSNARSSEIESYQRLKHQASLDPLTGLSNRLRLDEVISDVVSKENPQGNAALLLVDLDHFKRVNDLYGHPVGDAALVHVATLLRRSCRRTDTASRLGGDELALFLLGASAEVAHLRAVSIVDKVHRSPLALEDGTHVMLSISVGVACVPDDAREPGALYAAADAALYRAKQSGRGCVGLSPSML